MSYATWALSLSSFAWDKASFATSALAWLFANVFLDSSNLACAEVNSTCAFWTSALAWAKRSEKFSKSAKAFLALSKFVCAWVNLACKSARTFLSLSNLAWALFATSLASSKACCLVARSALDEAKVAWRSFLVSAKLCKAEVNSSAFFLSSVNFWFALVKAVCAAALCGLYACKFNKLACNLAKVLWASAKVWLALSSFAWAVSVACLASSKACCFVARSALASAKAWTLTLIASFNLFNCTWTSSRVLVSWANLALALSKAFWADGVCAWYAFKLFSSDVKALTLFWAVAKASAVVSALAWAVAVCCLASFKSSCLTESSSVACFSCWA